MDLSKTLLDYYERHLANHGDTARGAAWPDEAGRALRFGMGLEIALAHAGNGPFVLCDLGCGTGELYRHLRDAGLERIRYVGIDRSALAIDLARSKFPDATFHCLDVEESPRETLDRVFDCDFVFANGLFTVKDTLAHADMWRFLQSMVEAAWPRARRGIIFNVMSKIVDWERDDLFHVSYDELASYLRGLGAHDIGFRAHHRLYELMAYALKTPAGHDPGAPAPDLGSRRPPVAIPVCRPLLPSAAAVLPYVSQADRERRYTNHGLLSELLTARLAKAIGIPRERLNLASSGTAALTAAILAHAGRASTDRPLALCPAYTFAATALAVELAGYTPVLVDATEDSWTLAPATAASHPLERVGLVVATAPYGQAFDQQGWGDFSRTTQVPVVIDAAAAFEALCSAPDALVGDVPVILSLHATKAFSTAEGGAVVCTDEALNRRIQAALNFGFDGIRECGAAGFNGKMSEYHAAVGLAELDSWRHKLAGFARAAGFYRASATKRGFGHRIVTAPRIASCYALFVAATAEEAIAVELALQTDGLDCRRWYGTGLQDEPYFRSAPHGQLPVTRSLGPRILGLPMAPDLTAEDVERIVTAVALGVASGTTERPAHAASGAA